VGSRLDCVLSLASTLNYRFLLIMAQEEILLAYLAYSPHKCTWGCIEKERLISSQNGTHRGNLDFKKYIFPMPFLMALKRTMDAAGTDSRQQRDSATDDVLPCSLQGSRQVRKNTKRK